MNYLFLVSILVGISSQIFAQEAPIKYHKVERVFSVEPSTNTYTSQNFISGYCKEGTKNHLPIYFGELETISELKASFTLLGKKKKLSKKNFITNNVITDSFYDGLQKTTIKYPSSNFPYDFEYSYKETTNDILFLANLRFQNTHKIDTFHYVIKLPTSHVLHYQIEDSLKQSDLVQYNFSQINEQHVYEFIGIPNGDGNYPTTRSATIRLIVTPKDKDPFDHYNDWYRELVKPKSNLSETNKKIFNEKVADLETDREKVAAIYNMIKDRTSYIAFEDGIGAVQPRDVNKIFTAHQGDCKDMSNLICSALQSIGFDAKIALSSTIGHSFNLDFASVSSANHAICVLQLGDEWLFLDATEDAGFFGMPSSQIQGRSVFVIDDDKGMLKEVPPVKAEENIVEHTINLKKNENGLLGNILFKYCGLSQLWLRSGSKQVAANKLELYLTDYLSTRAENLGFEEVDLDVQEKICEIVAKVTTQRNFTNIKDKTYLSLAFLPDPFVQEDDEEQTTLKFYRAIYQNYVVNIEFDNPIEMASFENVDLIKDGILFSFNVKQTTPKTIQITYKYVNEMLELKDNNLKNFRTIKNTIKQTLRKSIIYENRL